MKRRECIILSEFVSLKKIYRKLPRGINKLDVLMLVGKRTGGKSFAGKEKWIKDFLSDGNKAVLLRRNEEDFKKGKASNYWRDINEEKHINKWTHDYECVSAYGSGVFLGHYNEKGNPTRDVQIGDYYALSTYVKSKSVAFPANYKFILFEEFISDEGYLQEEPRKLLQFVSTVSRGREDFMVLMIGNSVDTDCIYFAEWGLPDIIDQKPGTLNVVTHTIIGEDGQETQVNIGCYITDKGEGNPGKFIFGQAGKQVAGAWESKDHTHLDFYEKYKILYRIEIVWKSMSFIVELVKDDKGQGVRVSRKKKNKDMVIRRKIYAVELPIIDTDPLHTSGFKDTKVEQKIKKLLKDHTKVGYSTNICATAFKNMLKSTKLLGW